MTIRAMIFALFASLASGKKEKGQNGKKKGTHMKHDS